MSEPTISAIVAITANGVIGVDGDLPWHYSADLQRFKACTLGHTIVMGRNTFASIGNKPLPGRRNIVISRTLQDDSVSVFSDLPSALNDCQGDIWIIGGGQLYRAAMPYCQHLDVTLVPDTIAALDAVTFPAIDPAIWRLHSEQPLADDPRLINRQYHRIGSAQQP